MPRTYMILTTVSDEFPTIENYSETIGVMEPAFNTAVEAKEFGYANFRRRGFVILIVENNEAIDYLEVGRRQ